MVTDTDWLATPVRLLLEVQRRDSRLGIIQGGQGLLISARERNLAVVVLLLLVHYEPTALSAADPTEEFDNWVASVGKETAGLFLSLADAAGILASENCGEEQSSREIFDIAGKIVFNSVNAGELTHEQADMSIKIMNRIRRTQSEAFFPEDQCDAARRLYLDVINW
jgi:hypothetical protein